MSITSTARLRYVSISPRKMRLVAGIVKGMPVEKALGILNFTPKIAAHHLAKTLKSAAANALSQEGTDHISPEDLMIKSIIVDAAPTAKRIRFRAMGRIFRYRKRFCHLTIALETRTETIAGKEISRTRTTGKKESELKDTGAKTEAKTRVKTQLKTKAKTKTKTKARKAVAAKKSTATKPAAKRKTKTGKKNES